MATVVTKANLKAVTDHPLTVIDFWAPWCAPCKMMKPTMKQLEREFRGRIHFGTLDVSHQQKLAEKYTVMSLPSLVIFEHGKAHEKVTGYYTCEPLAKFLKRKLAEVKSN